MYYSYPKTPSQNGFITSNVNKAEEFFRTRALVCSLLRYGKLMRFWAKAVMYVMYAKSG